LQIKKQQAICFCFKKENGGVSVYRLAFGDYYYFFSGRMKGKKNNNHAWHVFSVEPIDLIRKEEILSLPVAFTFSLPMVRVSKKRHYQV
jgi:hypothetical protein